MFDYAYSSEKKEKKEKINIEEVPPKEVALKIAPLEWAEHCLECSAPLCYTSCEMFEEGPYHLCRRTAYGIRMEHDAEAGIYGCGVSVAFRKWAKLKAVMPKYLLGNKEFVRLDKLSKATGKYNTISLPRGNKALHLYKKFLSLKVKVKSLMKPITPPREECEVVLLSFYSHAKEEVKACFDFQSHQSQGDILLKRVALDIKPLQVNTYLIPLGGMPEKCTSFELYPENNYPLEVTFFWADMIKLNKESKWLEEHREYILESKHANKVKCVVWDLDNTLWDGIIGEDGKQAVKLKSEVVEVIKELDQRGILNSICSKNDEEVALEKLKEAGIEEYFLVPQINWLPKSHNINKVAQQLNIGLDSLAFVDDSEQERTEIAIRCPSVRVYKETSAAELSRLPEFDVPVTNESKERRKFYEQSIQRNKEMESSNLNYGEFVKSCNYEANVFKPESESDVMRCYELFQRTNQLNASARRLSKEELFFNLEENTVLAVSCKDKYGEYGLISCIILNTRDGKIYISDFVMSCRMAGKKLESALLKWIMEFYQKDLLDIQYVPTERNHVLKNELVAIGGTVTEDVIEFMRDNVKDSDWISIKCKERENYENI